jgi:hypothetical protein
VLGGAEQFVGKMSAKMEDIMLHSSVYFSGSAVVNP